MKIGFIYDSVDRAGLDCSRPDVGNPGVGGTQYCFLMLMYYYQNLFEHDELIVYEHIDFENRVVMPHEDKISYKHFDSLEDCCYEAKKDNVDVLLFNFHNVMTLSPIINKFEINSIVWIHNWIRGDILRTISKNQYIKRAVFLVKEHYDRYIDDPVINKSVYIHNMFNTIDYPIRDSISTYEVTYVGALIYGKGFDALAKAWKEVVRAVPEAQLNVIGTGNLYGGKVKCGSLGVAEKDFEDRFIKYITDDTGELLSSVHFHGLLGSEKNEIYRRTKVGIVNPTGRTEVCPISALEMEAAEIPVISKKINGLPNVIKDNKTGILVKKEKQLSNAIVSLLKNDNLNAEMGKNARSFVIDEFNPIQIAKRWNQLFIAVVTSEKCVIDKAKGNYFNNFKWLRIILFYLKQLPLLKRVPSLIHFEGVIYKMIHRS